MSLSQQIGMSLFGVLVVTAFAMGVIAPFNRYIAWAVIGLSIASALASFVITA